MADQAADPAALEAEGNPELEAQRPDWLPDNFKDEQALLSSYREAESALKRAQQEAQAERAAREALEEQQQEAFQAQQYQTQQDDIFSRIEQAREMGDIRAEETLRMQALAASLAPMLQQNKQPALAPEFVADYADKTLAGKYGDWDSYKSRAAQWAADTGLINDEAAGNPSLLAQRLEYAYQAIKGQDVVANPQQFAQQQHDLSQEKLQAQTLAGTNGRPAPADDNVVRWQEIANAPTRNYGDLF